MPVFTGMTDLPDTPQQAAGTGGGSGKHLPDLPLPTEGEGWGEGYNPVPKAFRGRDPVRFLPCREASRCGI